MPSKKIPSANSVTIRDVAQLAGVSPATVSKVLNGVPYVSQEALARVRAAVEQLNYRPNSIARSLKSSRTSTLGLITNDLEGVFTMSMMRGVEEVASAQGFSVMLCNSYGDPERERAHLQVLLDKQIDGVILLNGFRVHERGAPALPLGKVPVVYLYQYTHALEVPSIVPDDFGGAVMGTEHLIACGHKRIGVINGPANYEASHFRLAGYRQALEAAGLTFDPNLVRAGKWYESSGYALTHELMSLPAPPDALFCMSDSLAVAAMSALRELGLRVPRDISIVGFDNRPFAQHQTPPLTTILLPLVEMGHLAGELLLRAIQTGEQTGELHRVPCAFIHRASTRLVAPSYQGAK
jgi:LacI family transcriptional regulator